MKKPTVNYTHEDLIEILEDCEARQRRGYKGGWFPERDPKHSPREHANALEQFRAQREVWARDLGAFIEAIKHEIAVRRAWI
jgi:hypothetical protein